jgi:DNA-binding MarR family transcriptional regulator
MPTKRATSAKIDLDALPGYHIRRLQQIAVAIFLQETESLGMTPIQYAALQGIANAPGIDQRRLARSIGLDTSTIASVIDRLEARGLVQRGTSPDDRRVRLLTLTVNGASELAAVLPSMQRAQQRILEPLPKAERDEFMRMLRTLVTANNDLSRAPRVS